MRNLLYIGNKLSKHGFTATSIETLGPMLESDGFTVFYASDKKNKTLRLSEMLLKTFTLRNKADFIIIDTYSTSNFWYAFLVSQTARLLKKKYIPVLRGGDLPKRLLQNPKASRMIFNHAYKNIAPSRYLLHHFEKQGIPNIVHIPNVLEIQNYPFTPREQVGPQLLWVRSFAKIYNPALAIEAFKIIKKDFPEAALCMVGPEKDGSLQATKDLASKYGLEVRFTGKLSKQEWISLSEEYAVFINTTHFDNTPVSVMEAMALGLPIISTNVGGIPFLLEEETTALLIDDGDALQLAEAVTRLCHNSTLTYKLSVNGRHLAESFDWEKVKKLWKGILC